jgi:hypothetical protein
MIGTLSRTVMFPVPDSLGNLSMLTQVYMLDNTVLRFDTVNLKGVSL